MWYVSSSTIYVIITVAYKMSSLSFTYIYISIYIYIYIKNCTTKKIWTSFEYILALVVIVIVVVDSIFKQIALNKSYSIWFFLCLVFFGFGFCFYLCLFSVCLLCLFFRFFWFSVLPSYFSLIWLSFLLHENDSKSKKVLELRRQFSLIFIFFFKWNTKRKLLLLHELEKTLCSQMSVVLCCVCRTSPCMSLNVL